MAIAQNIRCSHCGAPVEFKPGELVATCKYCGFTTVIETGQAFTFEHSLMLNSYSEEQVERFSARLDALGFHETWRFSKKS